MGDPEILIQERTRQIWMLQISVCRSEIQTETAQKNPLLHLHPNITRYNDNRIDIHRVLLAAELRRTHRSIRYNVGFYDSIPEHSKQETAPHIREHTAAYAVLLSSLHSNRIVSGCIDIGAHSVLQAQFLRANTKLDQIFYYRAAWQNIMWTGIYIYRYIHI